VKVLQNTWYMAAWTHELDESNPLGRTIGGIEIAFFRADDGTAAAVYDRCPHRFAPLSLGQVKGNNLQCGYHGLTFDCTGKCVDNPEGDQIPKRADIRYFPVIERYKVVWVWLGEPGKADANRIPDYSIHDDGSFRSLYGYTAVKANYELITDNLLDLSHTRYIHPGFGGLDYDPEHSFNISATQVDSNYFVRGSENSIFGEAMFPTNGGKIDEYNNMRWYLPSCLILEVVYTHAGDKKEDGSTNWASHILTPETEHSTHYFWASAVDKASPLDDETHLAFLKQAFNDEDKPIIEACSKRLGGVEFWDAKPVVLEVDRAAVGARRMLSAAIKNENDETL